MKQRYWFKAYNSGYGWYPQSWQGWLTVILYIGFLVYSFLQGEPFSNFLQKFFIFTAILIIITYLKGESITWGSKGKEQHEIP
jgi:hypothetical protein